ncbi:hypothetical protein GCM10022381_26800 [Leifsonia kafniensis]|uniref:Extracellular solute-binding protein n=1 Tax=Leifsonia kafniensis TaxID=475957 RepID=A0ABP7KN07_9MICO
MTAKKRISLIAASSILVGSLVACAPQSAQPEATEDIALTLSTWSYSNEFADWWDDVIGKFEKANPTITVEIQQTAFADYGSTITTQAVAGSEPDIIHVPTPITTLPAWAKAGFLAPLDDYLKTTDVPKLWPAAQSAMEWNGTSYGVLLVDYGYNLFYNEALLTEAGVGVPTTPEELVAAAKAVTDLPGDEFGFAITDDNTVNFVRDALVFTTGMKADWVKDGDWNFSDPDVVAALDVWRELGKKYSPIGTNFAAKREAFLAGNSAMMIEGPFYYATVQGTADPALVDSLKIATTPFEVSPGDVSHGLALSADLDENTRAAAEKFLDFVTSTESLTTYSKLITSPTARPGTAQSLLESPDTAPIVEAHEASKLIIDPSNEGLRSDYAKFAEVTGAALHSLLQSDAPSREILVNLDRALDDAGLKP